MHRSQQTRHLFGSTAYITLVAKKEVNIELVFSKLWNFLGSFEQRFSRFLPTSELSDFNAHAGENRSVSIEFIALLQSSQTMSEQSQGLYNPLILPALQQAGYKGSWPNPSSFEKQLNYEDRQPADWKSIEIGDTWAKIPPHTALDFGGIGKGYALDQLAELLANEQVTNYWLSLGGDIICCGYDVNKTSWRIGIQQALNEAQTAAYVENNGQRLAIATSGITKRQGTTKSGKWHHIIDPRTAKPAETDILTATVCADSAINADVTAKCIVIEGSKRAKATLQQAELTDVLLQLNQGSNVQIQQIGALWST